MLGLQPVDAREELALDNGGLGLLLLAIAVGSLVALPSAGALVARWGAGAVVRAGVLLDAVGLREAERCGRCGADQVLYGGRGPASAG